MHKIGKNDSISIKIFGYEGGNKYPIYISKILLRGMLIYY